MMNKKAAVQITLREVMTLAVFFLFAFALFSSKLPTAAWNFITQKPDLPTQDKLTRLATEINSLQNSRSATIPFPVNQEVLEKYSLKTLKICEGEQNDKCNPQVAKLCIIDTERPKPRPFCQKILNGNFNTDEFFVDATTNVLITKNSDGIITISNPTT